MCGDGQFHSCHSCEESFLNSVSCSSDGPLSCAKGYFLENGNCLPCNVRYYNSLTCDANQPLTCKEGWYYEASLSRFPLCYSCSHRFRSSLACDEDGPLSCETGFVLVDRQCEPIEDVVAAALATKPNPHPSDKDDPNTELEMFGKMRPLSIELLQHYWNIIEDDGTPMLDPAAEFGQWTVGGEFSAKA